MKFYVILVLCFAVVLGEKKINLEDIERDNLQSEAQTEDDNVRTDEPKYNSDKTGSNGQLQYRPEFRLIGGQQPQEVKYVVQPEAYIQDPQLYQQQQPQQQPQQQHQPQQQQQQEQQHQQQHQQQQYSAALELQQQRAPQQFYTPRYQPEVAYSAPKSSPQISYKPQLTQGLSYRSEVPIGNQIKSYQQKSSPQISYRPELTQGLSYQSEVPIGNQIQSHQQKSATQKFTHGVGKATRYANIPSSGNQQEQFYYPNVNAVSSLKSQLQPLLHRLAGEAARKIPAYTTTVSQGPKISYQPQPQIQYVYEPQYVQPSSTQSTQKLTYAVPEASAQAYSSPQSYAGLMYSQQSSLYTEPKLAYAQAYYIQPQLDQYYQEPAYTPVPQGNSLSYPQSQSFYIPANFAQQLQTQIVEQQGSHSISQNYAKIPEEPRYSLTVPQISAQNFKNGPITQLQPVHSGISHTSNQLHYSSGSNSLLGSYTPSHVIAAQDSERYRERPLHLEGGFLPSKGSFVHSHNEKRKSE